MPGKTPWTCNRIDKATDKVIDKLYAECLKGYIKTQQQLGDMNLNLIASRFMGVKNVDELTRDINRNPLITGSITNALASNSPIEGSTTAESIGASVYAKWGNYLGFVALGCEIFTHMNWARFIELAAKQRREKADTHDSEEFDIINE